MVAKPHAFINAARADVVVHDMKKWRLIALHLEANQLLDEAPRETTTLEVGVGANAADLSQPARLEAFACHGYQSPGLKHTKVLAELAGSGGERSRLCDSHKFKHLRYVLRPRPDGGKCVIGRGNCGVPHQLVPRRVGMYSPAGGRRP